MSASSTWAMGLGDISSTSFLGQPLEARIEILDESLTSGAARYEPSDLRVRSLSKREAIDLGIELAGDFQSYRLQVVESGSGLSIVLKSLDPVNEPYLNILIELAWVKGKVYREYTVLLDPLVLSVQTPSGATRRAQPGPISLPTPTSIVQPRPSTRSRAPRQIAIASGSDSYRIQSGDSLSKIADRLVAGTSTRRQDMMQWLVQANPRAFIAGDMNRMKAGSVLNLPAGRDVETFIETAAQSVAAPIPAPTPAAEPQKSESAPKLAQDAPVEPAVPVGERLTIVTQPGDSASAADEAVAESEELVALRAQVALTNETVDRLRRENKAMRDRMLAIEKSDYVATLEQLVILKEEELNELRARAKQRAENRDAAVAVKPSQQSDTQPQGEESTERRQWLVALLVLAVLGAAFFLYRWRSKDKIAQSSQGKSDDDEGLLRELDAIIQSRSDGVTANSQIAASSQATAIDTAVIDETVSAFDAMGKGGRARKFSNTDRRPEAQVKYSIQEKTRTYQPPQETEAERLHHDDLDKLISDALAAANRGAYDVAEALLMAEQTQQSENTAYVTRDGSARLETALQFVQELRQRSK